jgi:NAD(P)H-hydrate epimerase
MEASLLTEVTQELVRRWIPKRLETAHKGDFGRVHILAGSVGFTGAPYFAAEAAARTGAGLVFLHVPAEIWPVIAVKCNEAMPDPIPQERAEIQLIQTMNVCNAVLIGPGLGREESRDERTRLLTKELLPPLVLDADGINAVAGHIDVLKARKDRLTVLTPHEGEFSRLLDGEPIGLERAAAAESFARKSGCVVVLKGHRTVTAFPDGRLFVNTTGNPGMARGGSGDVLAGIILSLLGQGLKPQRAIPAAVWIHGRAGDLCAEELGEYGMTPTDILNRIPKAFLF